MFHNHPRKTSIPIHFNFARSKRSTPSPTATTCPLTVALRGQKRCSSAPGQRRPASVAQLEWTPVEIANFPPQLQRADFLDFLNGYCFLPEFEYPVTPRFTRPFRTIVSVSSVEEAKRMVGELDGKTLAGRRISVKIVGKVAWKNQEDAMQELVDELKSRIISMYKQALGVYQRANQSRYGSSTSQQPFRRDSRGSRGGERWSTFCYPPEERSGSNLRQSWRTHCVRARQGDLAIRGRWLVYLEDGR